MISYRRHAQWFHIEGTQIFQNLNFSHLFSRGGGTQLWVTRHVPPKRPYFFSLAFTERPPFLPTFTQRPPIFNKFWQTWWNVEKFLAILALKAPIFWCISLKDPLFLCTLSPKDPFFWPNLSPKDPYIWGNWWHSYVTFICECPRGFLVLL